MPDPDAVKRLLSGEISPTEIEDDAALYSMAERIYGAEVLEEMTHEKSTCFLVYIRKKTIVKKVA